MVVLIAGASSGIGRALALEYAKKNANLVLLARRADRLEQVAQECRKISQHSQVLCITGDVGNVEDVENAVTQAIAAFGKINIVIANAGIAVEKTIAKLSDQDLTKQFNVNVFGVLRTIRACLPALRQSQGRLAIVGSAMSYIPISGAGAYTMSKFAVRALADTLRMEEPTISVCLICPGFIESEIRAVDNNGVFHPEAKEKVPSWLIMKADRAATLIVRAIEKRKPEYVVTWYAKLGVVLQRFAPQFMAHLWKRIR
jgi:short-subunit dehydrogenase